MLLRCSNYHHSKAGLWEPIKIGLYEDIFKEWKLNYSYYIILTAVIFTIFTLHLLLFALRKSEKEYLYFGIFSMMIFIRNLTVNMRVLFEWFPDFNYEIYEKIEYFSAYGTPMAIGLFFYYSLKEDFHKPVIKGILVYGVIVFLCILVLPVYYYSQLKVPFNLYILLTGSYIVFYLVPTAMFRKRKYSKLLFLGVINLFIAAVFDIFRSSQVIHFST
ncbi:MAG: 7TM-DISM domain-containing protein [Chloroflexia bacterium]|nr:7TM-DISM domain-containing protein [Chloroflexia bacterium]